MKRINFRHPRYAIPLIILPFLVLLNYLWLDMTPAATAAQTKVELTETTALNTSLPDANLRKREMKDKFSAFRDEFKYRTDYSAMQEIGEDRVDPRDIAYGSVYTEEERRMLDSLNNRILSDQQPEGFMERVSQRQRISSERYASATASVPGRSARPMRKVESAYEEEMRLFREQMMFIDSLSRVGEEPVPSRRGPQPMKAHAPASEKQEPTPLPVTKSRNTNKAFFNTITADSEEQFIRAILDEGLKVMQGGRIRIRLLDDIYVRDYEIKKGSYLYGTVSGFSAQRIEITIRSILYGNQIIPVDLSIYDNDGLAGLYVPDSQFRDFTKELAGNVSSGQTLTFEDSPDNASQMLYSMLERVSQTTTRAAGKAIRKNKAKLKYNTIVYLIDNKAQ
ncbi:conjugative transposon protein TraM [Pontibacter sp. SGAir0037]|uniref:conjugative transposon protein TraM n=1 Tax=Pontibacter sp. SGAir0037 TaxID=2571030 RepID=UPI0010CD1B40|nr:conjugative transposon protein TraM [Pontibacter sp. SGAir0037]QCR25285.1 conjugative transposon protein TraM [Pontibacter sp. SGAir0037]